MTVSSSHEGGNECHSRGLPRFRKSVSLIIKPVKKRKRKRCREREKNKTKQNNNNTRPGGRTQKTKLGRKAPPVDGADGWWPLACRQRRWVPEGEERERDSLATEAVPPGRGTASAVLVEVRSYHHTDTSIRMPRAPYRTISPRCLSCHCCCRRRRHQEAACLAQKV
ncbi:hypothetical protein LZ31DRAFT_83390 [Colletotrichum somersetense]|nr:hypothetical protein LZ31DRAFT_83390 [Colletotrichum somersetense]